MPLAVNFDHFRWLDSLNRRELAVEWVGPDPFGTVAFNRRRGGAARLASRLILERRDELAAESMSGMASQYRRAQLRRKLLRSSPGDVPAGGNLQEVCLRVISGRHVGPHVQHDDLLGPRGPLSLPTGRHPEQPCEVSTRHLEIDPVTV